MTEILYRVAKHLAFSACVNFVFFLIAEFLMANAMVGVAHITRRDVETTLLVAAMIPALIAFIAVAMVAVSDLARRTVRA